MLLSKLVAAVNAKSFGETDYTYDDIHPYFVSAIAELNSKMDPIRHLPLPKDVSADSPEYGTSAYNFISDTHMYNYVTCYIVVAMDDAMLASTSRTELYRTQAESYKNALITELYSYMPIHTDSSAFDITGYTGNHGGRDIPHVTAWYDDSICGKLSSKEGELGNTLPTEELGLCHDNPYGTVYPSNPNEHIKKGAYTYEYIFMPNDNFLAYYKPIKFAVVLAGYDVDKATLVKIDKSSATTINIIQGDTYNLTVKLTDYILSPTDVLTFSCAALNLKETMVYNSETGLYELPLSAAFTNTLPAMQGTYDLTITMHDASGNPIVKTLLYGQPLKVYRKVNVT